MELYIKMGNTVHMTSQEKKLKEENRYVMSMRMRIAASVSVVADGDNPRKRCRQIKSDRTEAKTIFHGKKWGNVAPAPIRAKINNILLFVSFRFMGAILCVTK